MYRVQPSIQSNRTSCKNIWKFFDLVLNFDNKLKSFSTISGALCSTMVMQVNTFRYPEGLSEGVRRGCPPLGSCFVPMVVSYPGHSYANSDGSDDSYPSNRLLRSHFVRGGNSLSSTQTAFHLHLWRNIESRGPFLESPENFSHPESNS